LVAAHRRPRSLIAMRLLGLASGNQPRPADVSRYRVDDVGVTVDATPIGDAQEQSVSLRDSFDFRELTPSDRRACIAAFAVADLASPLCHPV
jgi:hypothetical protein